jgi:hypothetical protein
MVLGCDLAHGGKALGPETIARCERALTRYRELTADGHTPDLMMNAGMASNDHYPRQKDTMAIMMADWFIARGVFFPSLHCVFSPYIWGTRAEVRNAIDYACFHGQFGTVEFVSSAYHLRRIALIARRVLDQAKKCMDTPLPSVRCVDAQYFSAKALLEIRNLPGEFLLGLICKDLYDPAATEWC